MDLDRAAVEYATITFTADVSTSTVEASVDGRATWHPTVPGATGREVKILLRGPDAPTTTGSTLVTQSTVLWARVTSTPEILPIRAGVINISS